MKITKPIIHTGILKDDLGNIKYTKSFFEKVASKKAGAKIELNAHAGKEIGDVLGLHVEDDALYATMDIPDEYKADEIGFSAAFKPTKFNRLGMNSFEVVDGVLDAVVYVNDGTPVNDTRTITTLNNLASEGDDMDKDLAKKLGILQSDYNTLQADFNKLQSKYDKIKGEKTGLETQLSEKETQLTDANKKLKVYVANEETAKEAIIKKIIGGDKPEDDPRYEGFKKFDMAQLEAFIPAQEGNDDKEGGDEGNGQTNNDTVPRGVGSGSVEGGNQGNPPANTPMDYNAEEERLGL